MNDKIMRLHEGPILIVSCEISPSHVAHMVSTLLARLKEQEVPILVVDDAAQLRKLELKKLELGLEIADCKPYVFDKKVHPKTEYREMNRRPKHKRRK